MSAEESGAKVVRVFLRENSIRVTCTDQAVDHDKVKFTRGQFSPQDVEKVRAQWARRLLDAVLGRQTCAMCAVVHPFEAETPLPRLATPEEKAELASFTVALLEEGGYKVEFIDMRAKLAAAS